MHVETLAIPTDQRIDRKRMSEIVQSWGSLALGADCSLCAQHPKCGTDRCIDQPFPRDGQKKRRRYRWRMQRILKRCIVSKCQHRGVSQRYDASLGEFRFPDQQRCVLPINIDVVQIDELANTETSCCQQSDSGGISSRG